VFKSRKDEIDRACKTQGKGEKYVLNLSQKSWKEKTTWET